VLSDEWRVRAATEGELVGESAEAPENVASGDGDLGDLAQAPEGDEQVAVGVEGDSIAMGEVDRGPGAIGGGKIGEGKVIEGAPLKERGTGRVHVLEDGTGDPG